MIERERTTHQKRYAPFYIIFQMMRKRYVKNGFSNESGAQTIYAAPASGPLNNNGEC